MARDLPMTSDIDGERLTLVRTIRGVGSLDDSGKDNG